MIISRMSKIEQIHKERFPDDLLRHGLVSVPELNDMSIPFEVYKFFQWRREPWTWMVEQVITMDESDNSAKPFPNFKYLRIILEQYFIRKIIVVPKTRRMLLTHLFLSGLLPHQLLFVPYSDNIFVQISQPKARKNFRKRAKHTLQNLDPRFSFYPTFKDGKTIFIDGAKNPDNHSELNAIPSGADKCRGDTLTNAIYDEFAFQTHCEENLDAIKPALEGKNCRGAFISSANPGTVFETLTEVKEGSDFNQLMEGLSITENELNHLIIKCNYRAHPYKRSPEWYYKERYGTTPDGEQIPGESGVSTYTWLKEYEGQFNFPRGSRAIQEFEETLHCEPYKKLYPNGFKEGEHLAFGIDFGSRFPAFSIIGKDSLNRAVIHNVIMVANERLGPFLKRCAAFLDSNFPGWQNNFDIFPDPSGFKDVRGGNADPEALEVEEFFKKRAKNRKKTVGIVYGVRCINEQMSIKQGNTMGVIVNPAAGIFVNEVGKEEHGQLVKAFLHGYCYQKKKGGVVIKGGGDSTIEIDKDGYYDHMVDTIRYPFAYLWKTIEMLKEDARKAQEQRKKGYSNRGRGHKAIRR